jgi:hypothetical protein
MQPTYSVGVRIVDGDIAFSARSGPLGTRCGVHLNSATLPEGVALTAANFVVTTGDTKCHLGRSVTTPADQLEMLAYIAVPIRNFQFSLGRVTGVLKEPVTIMA